MEIRGPPQQYPRLHRTQRIGPAPRRRLRSPRCHRQVTNILLLLSVLCALRELCVKSSSSASERSLLRLPQCPSSKANSAPGNHSPASPESPGSVSTLFSSSTPLPTVPAFSFSTTPISSSTKAAIFSSVVLVKSSTS